MGEDFFCFMPRGILKKDDIKCYVLKLKQELAQENHNDKAVADRYLNKVLDRINEYYG